MVTIHERMCLPDVAQTLTLPLSKGDIIHHVKLVSEVYELHPRLMTRVYQSLQMSLSRGNSLCGSPFEPTNSL